jgi:hypothetical protein
MAGTAHKRQLGAGLCGAFKRTNQAIKEQLPWVGEEVTGPVYSGREGDGPSVLRAPRGTTT